jgi:hypothetical protein
MDVERHPVDQPVQPRPMLLIRPLAPVNPTGPWGMAGQWLSSGEVLRFLAVSAGADRPRRARPGP